MSAPKMIIRKRIITHKGKTRPACHVQLAVDDKVKALLSEHFSAEMLFKKAMMNGDWCEPVHPTLASTMANFLKSDVCPEITVKSLLQGQLYQANTIWEVMCFEVAAKFAFEALLQVLRSVLDFGNEQVYLGQVAIDIEAAELEADAEFEQVVALEAARAAA